MKGSNAEILNIDDSYHSSYQNDINLNPEDIKRNQLYSFPFDYNEASDEALVSLYVNNQDEEAFNQIVQRYNEIITGFAIKLIRNPEDAEEIKQDVFLILVTKLHTFKGNSKFSTWLYKVTLNTCYKHLNDSKKRSKREIHIDESFLSQRPALDQLSKSPDEIALYKERMKLISSAANELTENNQEIFTLKDIKGFSNAEVGEAMGLSISAVKSRVLRTRLSLREKISDYFTLA